MAEEQTRIRQISWMELFPWLGLVRAVRLAFAPRMLILAAIGLGATNAGWGLVGWVFSGNTTDGSLIRAKSDIESWRDLQFPDIAGEVTLPPVSIGVLDPATSRAQEPWKVLNYPFAELFRWEVTVRSFTYLLLCGLWALLVWSLFGGAITRGAALWFAREDRLGFRRSLAWGVKKWPAYFSAPMFPMIGILIAVIPTAIICLLLKASIGVLVIGIVWPIVLLCGLFVAILLVGLLFGWPLMWPTISAEGSDSFDALSRSYSYTYQRPVHYLFYAAVAGVLGMLAWVVVLIFAKGVIEYSYWAASWGSGGERIQEIRQIAEAPPPPPDLGPKLEGLAPPPSPEGSEMLAYGAKAIGFWVRVVKYIAMGFLFSYFWCAATYIYFLLRQSVDATELDEVHVVEEAEPHSLPPLANEPGMPPQVIDTPPPAS
jgi:hypothetical protein